VSCSLGGGEEEEASTSGLTVALHPSIAWSTPRLHDSHVVPICRSSGATVHLSRWPHILQPTRGWLLHIELRSRLG
jgi:hypothetical protein